MMRRSDHDWVKLALDSTPSASVTGSVTSKTLNVTLDPKTWNVVATIHQAYSVVLLSQDSSFWVQVEFQSEGNSSQEVQCELFGSMLHCILFCFRVVERNIGRNLSTTMPKLVFFWLSRNACSPTPSQLLDRSFKLTLVLCIRDGFRFWWWCRMR